MTDVFDPATQGEITSEHLIAEWSGGDKLRESCAAVRSSLSHLLTGNSDAAQVEKQLTATLKGSSLGVVGAQVGNLIEYVELYCLASLRGAFHVRSLSGMRGTLWFEAGQLVHAQVGSLSGEDAALQILSWGTGTLTPSTSPFPTKPSIDSAWQSLVLKAEAWEEIAS